jgi:uncharacterized protein YcbK (DUF882 family)
MDINWNDPASKISDHFTVKDALWLPTWNRMASANDGLDEAVKTSLIALFKQMDVVRDFFGKPIIVHVTYRPDAYNKLIGGAPASSHVRGMAVDFHVVGVNCDDARAKIVPMLEAWGMRCENLPGSSWVHLDMRAAGPGGHFFKP